MQGPSRFAQQRSILYGLKQAYTRRDLINFARGFGEDAVSYEFSTVYYGNPSLANKPRWWLLGLASEILADESDREAKAWEDAQ